MLYMIGGTSEHSNDINGAVVNVRQRGNKICESFLNDVTRSEAKMKIKKFEFRLHISSRLDCRLSEQKRRDGNWS